MTEFLSARAITNITYFRNSNNFSAWFWLSPTIFLGGVSLRKLLNKKHTLSSLNSISLASSSILLMMKFPSV